MSLINHKVLLAFSILLLATTRTFAFDEDDPSIQILYDDDQQFVFSYQTPPLDLIKLGGARKPQIVVLFKGCDLLKWPDLPILPFRTITIAVPGNKSVSISIDEQNSQERILDAPLALTLTEETTANFFIQNKPFVFEREKPFPKQIISTPRIGWSRDQKIVQIKIFPLQYLAVSQRLFIHDKITVRFLFTDARTAQPAMAERKDASFAHINQGLTLNQSQSDRVVPNRRMFKSRIVAEESARQWFKIPIAREGIYKIEYSQLAALGMDSTTLVFDKLHILYGGGRVLPQDLRAEPPDLRETATQSRDVNNDGLLGKKDALIFYGQGVTGWSSDSHDGNYIHYSNPFTDENIYWLAVGGAGRKAMPERIYDRNLINKHEAVATAKQYAFFEKDYLNPMQSGTDWVWDRLSGNMSREYIFNLPHAVTSDSGLFRVRLVGFSFHHHDLSFVLNDQLIGSVDVPYNRQMIADASFVNALREGENRVRIIHKSNEGQKNETLLDWIEIHYRQKLQIDTSAVTFHAPQGLRLQTFSIAASDDDCLIYDISDAFAPKAITTTSYDSLSRICFFVDSLSATAKKYLALASSRIKSPATLEPAANPLGGLRSVENKAHYLVIAHKSLIGPELERFVRHRQDVRYWRQSGLAPLVQVVDVQRVYDNFAWGLKDPTAIRNFLRYAFENWQIAPSYVLLVGVGTFDFRNHMGANKQTLVPSFEKGSIVSDDWFVNLTNDRFVDMMIGRLPVKNREELAVVIDKIIRYENNPAVGPWRSRILLAADDVFRNRTYSPEDFFFTRDSEVLADLPEVRGFDLHKVYLDRYPMDRSFSKPEARQAFLDEFNSGCLMINFFGHANWNMLAHENMFRTPIDLRYLANGGRLPLLYAGTCEISRFDDPTFDSMAEYLLLHPDGGAIAVVGSARWTMHLASFNVSNELFKNLFSISGEENMTIGQALTLAKTKGGFPDQTEIMFLFGDPAMVLNAPSNAVELSVIPDSLSLHQRIHVKGRVCIQEKTMTDFDGTCFLRLYDSFLFAKRPLYSYWTPGGVILETEAPVVSGRFETSFFAASDTLAGGPRGKLYAFATTKSSAAIGAVDSIAIKPDTLSAQTVIDSVAPDLQLFLAGASVQPEEEIQTTLPRRLAGEIKDDAAGFSRPLLSGRNIQLKIDDYIENDFYETAQITPDPTDDKSWHFEYDIKNLALGPHTLTIIVTDAALNPRQQNIDIVVVPPDLVLSHVLNYPNPADKGTFFTFDLSRDAEIRIKIYTLAGRCIRTLSGFGQYGYNSFPDEPWDLTDDYGDPIANGVYLYKIIAKAIDTPFLDDGDNRTEFIGKLMVVR